jgi:hypothetical protein
MAPAPHSPPAAPGRRSSRWRWQTCALDRSVARGQTNTPDDSQLVSRIKDARRALGGGDRALPSSSSISPYRTEARFLRSAPLPGSGSCAVHPSLLSNGPMHELLLITLRIHHGHAFLAQGSLSVGVSGCVSYQSREDERTQSPIQTVDRGWSSLPGLRRPLRRSGARSWLRGEDPLRLSLPL